MTEPSSKTISAFAVDYLNDGKLNWGDVNRNKTYFGSLFLELFDGSLVNPTAFVNQVASSSGLARVYVSDNDDVDVNLFLHYVDCEEIFATRCSWKEIENYEHVEKRSSHLKTHIPDFT